MSRQDFVAALLAEIPELQQEVEECEGQLQNEMDAFAFFTQAAKGRGDWPVYERCIVLADRVLSGSDAVLGSAFRSSFLEHLDFEGSRGPEAWRRFTPQLQAAWEQIAATNRRLMALPQKGSGARSQQGSQGNQGHAGHHPRKKKTSSRKGPRGRRR
jgi:hypothetical protein